MKSIWSTLVFLMFAVWWGGITFYSAVVVPIGTAEIGSLEQGFITKEVAVRHNVVLMGMVVILSIEAFRRRDRVLVGLTVLLAGLCVALYFQHARLQSLMDMEARDVASGFYSMHAVYLWLTTAEWCMGVGVGWSLLRPDTTELSASKQ